MRRGLSKKYRAARPLAAALMAMAVAACGGGGGGDSSGTVNRAPVVDAGSDQAATVGVQVVLDGTASDPDGDAVSLSWTFASRPSGSLATLTGTTSDAPRFTPDVGGRYVVSLRASDGRLQATDLVNVDANTPPVAIAGPDQNVDVGATVTLDGRSSTDADGDTLAYAWSLTPPAGSATTLPDPASAMPSFVPDTPGTYTIRLVVNDGQSDSLADTTLVTARPVVVNTPPVADAGPDQSAIVGDTVALDGGGSSDADGDSLGYSWTLTVPTGSAATLSDASNPNPSFPADVAGTYTATLIVNDGQENSAPDTVAVVVSPEPNASPVADAGLDQSVVTGSVVNLDGGASTDPDGDPIEFSWALEAPAGSAATLVDQATATPSFTADVGGLYTVTLTVSDGEAQGVDSVRVTANTAPVADAGPDQSVVTGSMVTLDGNASADPDGDSITFSWALQPPAGSGAVLTDASSRAPSFIADLGGVYTATLTVSDGKLEGTVSDSVLVTVNTPPLADAGPNQSVVTGSVVTLDGSASTDPDGDPISLNWTLAGPDGGDVPLSDPAAVMPTFTAGQAGTYTATLQVTDDKSGNAMDSVRIDVVEPGGNLPPTADAGPSLQVNLGESVTLDGSGSNDPEGQPLQYAWTLTRPDGGTTQLAGVTPDFIADVAGVFTASLIVSDGIDESLPDSAEIVVNGPPSAVAGPDREATTGEPIQLDGSASSDPDGDPISFRWELESPAGSGASLVNPFSATPSFVPDIGGVYTATLTVSDGKAQDVDAVQVTANTPPAADAGPDQSVATGSVVTLDGGASMDPDGDGISFSWALAAPDGSAATLADPATATPSFVADLGGVYTATLTVSDGKAQGVDSVQVTANTAPVADAGPDQNVDVGTQVTLNGSGSSDADGDTLNYAWTLEPPAGSGAALSDPTASSPTFTPDVEGSYVARLVVNDGRVESPADTVTVTASTPEVTISGRVTYDRVPHTPGGGLDFDNTFRAPLRGATVEAIDGSGAIIVATSSDGAGDYSLTVPPESSARLRVKAELARTGTPAWNFRVVDNTSGDALYTLEGTAFDSGSEDLVVDLHAPSGWDSATGSYTSARAAAPFAILDTTYDALQLLLEADPNGSFPALTLHWSPLNRPSAQFDPDVGDIVSTAYVVGFGVRGMFILGDANSDTDEYDAHVVAHEFGHYIEDRLARTDSIGGSHTITAPLDPRLAFSEGWSNAFSAMAVGDPVYKDSRTLGSGFGFVFDIEANSVTNEGWYNESSVHSVLYDIYDDAADGLDATAAGFGPIYEGITTWHAQSDALTSIFSLIPELKNRLPADAANIDQLLSAQSIVGSGMNIWASTETNDAGLGADVLPVYTDLTVGAGNSATVCTISQFGDFNRLSNRRFVRFDVTAAGSYRIAVTGPADSDPDLAIYRRGLQFLSLGSMAGQEIISSINLNDPGTYVMEVYDSCIVDGSDGNAACPTNTPSQTCLDVTVAPL